MAKKQNNWEVKDRVYVLKNNMSPLTYAIKSSNIFWFDEELGYERELKYTKNQRTVFVDEFKGPAKLEHVVFENGTLTVPRQKQVLQKLLSIYHPDKDNIYYEFDPEVQAEDQLETIEYEIQALTLASQMDIDMMEAIMRVEIGSSVSKMSSKELKRDFLIFAKNNPKLFIELANDDNVAVRNIAVKAAEQGIIKLSDDQRTFKWASNGRALMTVPFDENPYSALAAWFKTDEGVEVYKTIEKRLK